MKVDCKTCGKSHRIDPTKIRDKKARFQCTNCQDFTLVTLPGDQVSDQDADAGFGGQAAQQKSGAQWKGIGLRSKMVFLFVIIPVFLVAVSGIIHLKQMDSLSSALAQESSGLLEKIAKEIIANKARSVAEQCRTYLRKNPRLKREDFAKDKEFAGICVQKVGETGYTTIYSVPDQTGKSSAWVHPNPKIVGIDLPKALRKPLGDRYDDFIKIYAGAFSGQETMGYYNWKDKDGKYREKFMVSTPIAGTPYIIASTTYMDEFTRDLKLMDLKANDITRRSRNVAFVILAGTLVVLGIIVALFSNGLSKRIKTLTELAERISLGNLSIQIKDDSKDEIGKLASAIERMRKSIRISLDKLRHQ